MSIGFGEESRAGGHQDAEWMGGQGVETVEAWSLENSPGGQCGESGRWVGATGDSQEHG